MSIVVDYEKVWDALESEVLGPYLERFRVEKQLCLQVIKEMRLHRPLDAWVGEAAKMTERLVCLAKESELSDEKFAKSQEVFSNRVTGGGSIPLDTLLEKKDIFSPYHFEKSVEAELALYRHAEKSRGEETVVFVMPTTGVYGTHDFPEDHNIKEFAENKKLVVKRIRDSEELDEILIREKNISGIWIAAHGSSECIALGKDPLGGNSCMTGKELVQNWPKSHLAADARVVLEVCEAGKGFSNIAQEIATELEGRVTVVASKGDTWRGSQIKIIDEKPVSYTAHSSVVVQKNSSGQAEVHFFADESTDKQVILGEDITVVIPKIIEESV